MTNVNPFIVIEGNDATGKASVASFLGESLSAEVISFPRYASTSGAAVLSNLQGHWRPVVNSALFSAGIAEDATEEIAAAYMAVARPHVKRLAEAAGSVHVTTEMSPTTKPEDVAAQVGRAFREGLERGL